MCKRRKFYEGQSFWRPAAGGPLVHAAHRPAAGGGPASGNRQLVHQPDHAGGLRPHRRHLRGRHRLHHPGHYEPMRQRRVQQPGPALRHGRSHRHGEKGERGRRSLRRHRLSGHEHRHLRHDHRPGRRGGHGGQHHYLHPGYHHLTDGRLRRHHRGIGRGGAPQPVL